MPFVAEIQQTVEYMDENLEIRKAMSNFKVEQPYMTWNDFIFSKKISHWLIRHLVFWILYCTYFWVQSFAPKKFDEFFIGDTYYFAFLNLCCFAPVFIFAVYFFVYYLLPNTIKKKKYGQFILGFMLVYIFGTFINYFTAGIFLNNVHYSIPIEPNFEHKLEFSNYNTRWGMIIATVALGIKLSKDWYLQQLENMKILRKKTRTEMQLQKARIHPELLFRSLNTIYTNIQSGSAESTSMILNLSDLLSYSLYETDMELVPFEKELLELQHLIFLEQLNKESAIKIQVQTKGEISNKFIAPMVIVKLTEESITLLRNTETLSWLISLGIIVFNDTVSLHLSFIHLDEKSSSIMKWRLLIDNTRKRLSEYYSATDYQIEFAEENKKTVISLKIRLSSNTKEANIFSTTRVNANSYDPA